MHSLQASSNAIVSAPQTADKVSLAYETAAKWFNRSLDIGHPSSSITMPDRPGRPEKPQLLAPRDMPKRAMNGTSGKLALLHSLAHIELNAIDMTWDLIGRFTAIQMPRSFYDDWVQVGLEEAKHFKMLENRLAKLGYGYGDLPAHDGLWQAAQSTGHDLKARLAIVPMVLEARGLDITPPMIAKARSGNDEDTAKALETIYNDEKRHVAFGTKWFRFLCDRERINPHTEFQKLVRKYFKGALKPPFNDRARSEAGLTPNFYRSLMKIS
ncbi:ferritin-like domain-containing protein [Polycladidibacter stylochi]|uniref:ferritin-like domain-containing protein n=1 Tax=Polycladidibacter stylochi TaxID=1807766 RepID=UPI00082E2C6E|nr:ferritin-like domain-containing protein [Pseudovibrio stylochi]